jgi:hypothetical protein
MGIQACILVVQVLVPVLVTTIYVMMCSAAAHHLQTPAKF